MIVLIVETSHLLGPESPVLNALMTCFDNEEEVKVLKFSRLLVLVFILANYYLNIYLICVCDFLRMNLSPTSLIHDLPISWDAAAITS